MTQKRSLCAGYLHSTKCCILGQSKNLKENDFGMIKRRCFLANRYLGTAKPYPTNYGEDSSSGLPNCAKSLESSCSIWQTSGSDQLRPSTALTWEPPATPSILFRRSWAANRSPHMALFFLESLKRRLKRKTHWNGPSQIWSCSQSPIEIVYKGFRFALVFFILRF